MTTLSSQMIPSESTSTSLRDQIDPNNIPQHIAIIMDGNGRWAGQKDLNRIEGHRQGAETVRRIATASRKLGVKALTLYAFSDENWQRPKKEVAQLMELLAKFLVHEREELRQNQIRLQVIGSKDKLPKFVQKLLNETLEFTQKESEMVLNLALSYGARNEIIRGIQRLYQDIRKGKRKESDISIELFDEYLDTAGLPELDLLVRTSGEFRISNFLLWQIAYTEIHVTDVLWPDFQEEDLYKAILDYQKRERRFGLTSDQIQKSSCSSPES